MAKRTSTPGKQPLNFLVERQLAERIYAASDAFGGRKRLGVFMSAAALAFLEMDPRSQASFLAKVLQLELDGQVHAILAQPKDDAPRRPTGGGRSGK